MAQTYQPDEVQHQTVVRLNAIHQTLTEQVWIQPENRTPGLISKWRSWLGQKEKNADTGARSVHVGWGWTG
ncbi:hypothetical protein OS42_03050 [Dickeya oryzae]